MNKASEGVYVDQLRIDGKRLWRRHMEMARIGSIAGSGCCRLAMTQEDGAARDLLRSWFEAAGLETKVDLAGNMFGLRDGSETDAPLVLTGSHLDTQPHGGRFDGVSGVLCALEVAETLNDAGVTTRLPIGVVNWTNEEGVHFAPGLMGSSWFVGALSDAELLDAVSTAGDRFEDAARARGYLGADASRDFDIAAFFELHIEQGPVLEREGRQIGIVESVQGLRWLDVTVLGMDAHAGTTPMDQRGDTIQASAHILVALKKLGLEHRPDARVSVGYLKPATEGASTIAGRTDFVIDIRHPDAEVLDRLAEACRALCLSEAEGCNCRAEVSQRVAVAPVAFDPACVDRVAAAADHFGYAARRMASGALHDASNIATVAPSAMIFVPCKEGISHNVNESASPQDLEAGCNVLLRAVLASAGGETR